MINAIRVPTTHRREKRRKRDDADNRFRSRRRPALEDTQVPSPCGEAASSYPTTQRRNAGSPGRPGDQGLRPGRGTCVPPPLDHEACASCGSEDPTRSPRPRRPKPSCQAVLNSVTRSVAGACPPCLRRRIAPSLLASPSCEGVGCFSTYTLAAVCRGVNTPFTFLL